MYKIINKNTVSLRFYGFTVTVRFVKKNRNYGLQRKTVFYGSRRKKNTVTVTV